MHPYVAFMQAEKALAVHPAWSLPDEEDGYAWFDVALEIGGVVEASFVFHGGCYPSRPDRHVTFELRVGRAPGRPIRPLDRVDWRSATGHSNIRGDGTDWAGRAVGITHHHSFELNWNDQMQKMRGENLPVACPINEALGNFSELLTFTGNVFRISNIELVPAPRWEYNLI